MVSSVILFTFDGRICWARCNCPGSWHDSRIAVHLYNKLRNLPAGFRTVADTAFPNTGTMEGIIVTPIKVLLCLHTAAVAD